MSETFDPYYKWLGIKPKDQPPNHYRLLGVELFEADVDVIENAADQRMRHIRSLQTGANAAISQRILNEISTARVCLTEPVRRAEYDSELRPTVAAGPPEAPPPPPIMGTAVPPIAPPAPRKVAEQPAIAIDPDDGAKFHEAPRSSRPSAGRRRNPSKSKSDLPIGLMLVIAGLTVVVLLVVGVVLVLRQRREVEPPLSAGSTDSGAQPRPAGGTTGSLPQPPPVRPTLPLKLVGIAPIRLERGQNLRVQATVRDPERWKDQVQFAIGLGTPNGVRLDPKTGLLQWEPPLDAQRSYMFNIEAHAGKAEDSTSFQVDLPWGRGELVFKSSGPQTAYPGEPFVYHLSATDDDGPAQGVEYVLLKGPDGATIDPQTSQVRWKASEDQLGKTFPVTVRVTDNRGVSKQASFSIEVQKKPEPPADEGNSKKKDNAEPKAVPNNLQRQLRKEQPAEN